MRLQDNRPKKPIEKIHCSITKTGSKRANLTFLGSTIEELIKLFKTEIITQNKIINPFESTVKTKVTFRNYKGNQARDSKSISFIGFTPNEVKTIIENKIGY